MMTKNLLYKIIFSSALLALTAHAQSATTSEQVHAWTQTNGYIVLSEPVKLATLDPILSIGAHSKFTLPLIFESLITINSQQELQPVLAKSWNISSNNKSITVSLQPNHHFSDNTEVTAQEVVKSIYRLCSTKSQSYGQLQGLTGCTDHAKGKKTLPQVYAAGKYDVKFNINCNPTTFLYQLTSQNTVIAKQHNHSLIGSGPYLIHENKENYVVLNKNPFYYGDIEVKNSGIVLFYSGDNDIIRTLEQDKPDGALMYRMTALWDYKNSNYKLIKTNPNITEIFVMNNQKFPFNHPEVRKALSSEIYNNFNTSCIPGTHKAYGIIPNGIGGSLNTIPPTSLEEISPRQLFKKVPELKNKVVSVTIHQLDDIKNSCVSEQLIKVAKKYHINIKLKYHRDYSDLLPLYRNHKLDGFIELYVFKNREAYNVFEFFEKNNENHANIDNDKIDTISKEAIATPSSHDRFQAYHRLAQYIQDNNILIPLLYMDHGNFMRQCLSGVSDDFFFNPYSELPKISKSKECNN